MNNELTERKTRLAECEEVIERGLTSFIEVGNSLMEIRDKELYKVTHSNFKDYCKDRWNFREARVYQMISSAKVADKLHDRGVKDTPKNEWQVRPLSKIKDPKRKEVVWNDALARAENEGVEVTAKHVEAAVKTEIGDKREESINLLTLKEVWNESSNADKERFLIWVWDHRSTPQKIKSQIINKETK